jgi:hypothetical protein
VLVDTVPRNTVRDALEAESRDEPVKNRGRIDQGCGSVQTCLPSFVVDLVEDDIDPATAQTIGSGFRLGPAGRSLAWQRPILCRRGFVKRRLEALVALSPKIGARLHLARLIGIVDNIRDG